MTTYLINHLRQPGKVNSEVLDYLDQVQATLDPFGGKFIVQGGEVEVLEGAWAEAVIVLSFPDMTKARTWYRSSAYQDILRLRTDHVVGDVILIDGVGPDHTPGKYAQHAKKTNMIAAAFWALEPWPLLPPISAVLRRHNPARQRWQIGRLNCGRTHPLAH